VREEDKVVKVVTDSSCDLSPQARVALTGTRGWVIMIAPARWFAVMPLSKSSS